MNTASNLDMAGLAVLTQQQLPDPNLLPLMFFNLKNDHDNLKDEFDKLLNYLKQKGLDYA